MTVKGEAMIKRVIIIITLLGLCFVLLPLFWNIEDAEKLSQLSQTYVAEGAEDLGAANLVTAVVVSYRGLDTLGEVAVLFVATAGVTLLLGAKKRGLIVTDNRKERRKGSELLNAGAALLFPILLLFGVYIFVHGHLTPGGGFQGGVVIASAFVLLLFIESDRELNHRLLHSLEALSGAAYVVIGLLGIWLAAGFLDPRFLPSGEIGTLFSAGAIPLIYSLIGIKVGSELTGVVDSLRRRS